MKDSIVRDGNHFIRIDGKWCLIDGDWFNILMNADRSTFIVANIQPECVYSIAEAYPIYSEIKTNVWTRHKWACFLHYNHHLPNSFYEHRVKTGFMFEDGKLPMTFHGNSLGVEG